MLRRGFVSISLILISVILISAITVAYIYSNKFPLLYKFNFDPEWKNTVGTACNFGGCHDSETNKIYNYYYKKAIDTSDPSQCNNVIGYDGGDILVQKPQAISQCKLAYAIEKKDVPFCKSLSLNEQVQCLQQIAVGTDDHSIFTVDTCNQLETGKGASDCIVSQFL